MREHSRVSSSLIGRTIYNYDFLKSSFFPKNLKKFFSENIANYMNFFVLFRNSKKCPLHQRILKSPHFKKMNFSNNELFRMIYRYDKFSLRAQTPYDASREGIARFLNFKDAASRSHSEFCKGLLHKHYMV